MEKLLIVDDEEIELDGMAELIDWPSHLADKPNALKLSSEGAPEIVLGKTYEKISTYFGIIHRKFCVCTNCK